ncbi:PrpF domain-containing protein [Virgibacillus sp. 179-BFC.A HS]|uniref:PrpF domain-containing protein n=1 Tax=Tigheibacillus jepli TaxID=3035914 RepID=A0ABU5CF72_9BACI|nr:PrpF domain-containing protein [Virgibacillus sp. 179-BFC.A HS]MDY0404651.1 PrpF domain-containing protein [Virgibacillus sp. 179-BFC.A HS]
MLLKVPCTVMRGGTSKGLFFKKDDLPIDKYLRDKVILKAFGSPDPYERQIDGLGGATSTTSKLAIIEKRNDEMNSVNYTFGQVDIKTSFIDMNGNCGNLSSAVGPFAIDNGMVDQVEEPYTKVNIYNTNTGKNIVAFVPIKDGHTQYEGTFYISGVPNPGSKIQLDFMDPGGAITGNLLPTGKTKEFLQTKSAGEIEVSLVDATNPLVFIRAKDIGLIGTELPNEIDKNTKLLDTLLEIRAAAAIKLNLAKNLEDANRYSPAVPKMCFISEAQDYRSTENNNIRKDEIDIVARMLSMGKLHPTFAISGGICLAVAAKIKGTIVSDQLKHVSEDLIKIGHCGGIMEVSAEVTKEKIALRGTVFRTARCLMTGFTYVSV